MAATGAVLESKVELALAALSAGAGVGPATFFLPWQTERLPAELAAAFGPAGTLWVLKRDALSNGEGVFFVASPAEAEEVIASQRCVRSSQREHARMPLSYFAPFAAPRRT